MSTSERETDDLAHRIDAVPRDPPVNEQFRELDYISDVDEDGFDELLVAVFDEEEVDRWMRFQKKLLLDLEEVR